MDKRELDLMFSCNNCLSLGCFDKGVVRVCAFKMFLKNV